MAASLGGAGGGAGEALSGVSGDVGQEVAAPIKVLIYPFPVPISAFIHCLLKDLSIFYPRPDGAGLELEDVRGLLGLNSVEAQSLGEHWFLIKVLEYYFPGFTATLNFNIDHQIARQGEYLEGLRDKGSRGEELSDQERLALNNEFSLTHDNAYVALRILHRNGFFDDIESGRTLTADSLLLPVFIAGLLKSKSYEFMREIERLKIELSLVSEPSRDVRLFR